MIKNRIHAIAAFALIMSTMQVRADDAAWKRDDPVYNRIYAYAQSHSTTVDALVGRTKMSLLDFEDYIVAGEKEGDSLESVIERVTSLPKNNKMYSGRNLQIELAAIVDKLTQSDLPHIVDTYRKNELRFARDFKSRLFNDDLVFKNARQNMFLKGEYTIEFNSKSGIEVDCEPDSNEDMGIVADWNGGDVVNVTGIIDDVTLSNVKMISCAMHHK